MTLYLAVSKLIFFLVSFHARQIACYSYYTAQANVCNSNLL